jgi:hypothetical protein
MKRLARQPIFWLAVQALLLLALLQATGRLEPRLEPDSAGYREMSVDSLRSVLSSIRTAGYPIYLRAVRAVTGSDLSAPWLHHATWVATVIAFCVALQVAGFSAGASGAAASVLLYARTLFDYVSAITPDVAALSCAVLTMALLLVAVRRSGSVPAWLGLAAAGFMTYQMRPAYLFLVPLIPVLGVLLAAFVFRAPLRSRRLACLAAGLVAAAAIPFLLFCSLRWAVVGHFGLVSFGGYNLIGISGQFLDEELVDELSPKSRPLAQAIVERRRGAGWWSAPRDYAAMEAMYNPLIWEAAVPAAEELYGEDAVAVNRAVSGLAWEIIRRRPARYARWLVRAGREGISRLLQVFITDPGVRLALFVLLLIQLVIVARRWRSGRLPISPAASDRGFVEVNGLLWLALGFATAKLLLVILVEPPLQRYLAPATACAPPLMGVLAWHRFCQVFRGA